LANKVATMIEHPPTGVYHHFNGSSYVRFAWPTHQIEDAQRRVIGFVMPEVDFQNSRSLVTYTERRESARYLTPDQRSLPRRLAVCANLCALMTDLHSQGHAFVDFKDQNVRVYPDLDLVGFIDTDGFRIQGGGSRHFPGQHTTPTFNSPESVKGSKSSLGIHHDRFVLAILMFRILNSGIHPFQGIPRNLSNQGGGGFDLDSHIERQLYAYGAHANPELAPAKGSLHTFWDSRTLAMFERTFTTRDPTQRVSASDWLSHLRALQNGAMTRCKRHPKDIEHVHFASNVCPICAANGHMAPKATSAPAPVPHTTAPPKVRSSGSGPPASSGLPPPSPHWGLGTKVFLSSVIVIFAIALASAFF
jgi:DNA-binding helix-hairpin-helix protein with protein kinase domain